MGAWTGYLVSRINKRTSQPKLASHPGTAIVQSQDMLCRSSYVSFASTSAADPICWAFA